jgi:hypothetical protein
MAAVGLYAWRVEPHWLEFTHPEMPIRGLAPQLHGCTLAQISDIHAGPQVDDNYLIDSFRRVKEMTPDFVAYTGDWVTYDGPKELEQLQRVLEEAPRGRLGTVGILGNHDYGIGWTELKMAQAICNVAENAGITMLRNGAVHCGGLQFIGIDELWSPCFAPVKVLAQKGGDDSTVALCHNPDGADQPGWGKYQGWILAGHTHGGQCRAPFLPPPMLPVENRRYIAGEYDLSGNRKMYISRGVGHLLRIRFAARPEIPIFQLRRTLKQS